MNKLVVDASVVVKWFVPEVDTDNAVAILESSKELWVPDLTISEIGNILWKKYRLKELSKTEVMTIGKELNNCPMRIHNSIELVEATLEIATTFDRTFYDSLYLALAVQLDCEFVTADKKLFNAINNTELEENILLLADWGFA